MKILVTLVTVILLAVLAVIGYAYSGHYDISASSQHSEFANWLLSTTSRSSIERRAAAIEAPDLSDDALVRAGANDFNAMCVGCHGAPGQEPQPVGQGLNPAAPNLSESAQYMSPAELFWVTKNGIKMTGMPAWGATHEDDALWPVVSLMLKLPVLDADSYQALLASAEGMGHHEPAAPENEVPEGHEDHDHEH